MLGGAAGREQSSRTGMNRQMADFNIQGRPVNSSYKLNNQAQMQQVIPTTFQQQMAQCDLQSVDDNRSEYSVRTHSQFGQTSSYFSMQNGHNAGVSQANFPQTQHSPMNGVHNRAQQNTLEHYMEKAQKQRMCSPCRSPGRFRSTRSGSQQRQMQEACVKCDILNSDHSTSNFSAVTNAPVRQGTHLATAVSHHSLMSEVGLMQQAEM